MKRVLLLIAMLVAAMPARAQSNVGGGGSGSASTGSVTVKYASQLGAKLNTNLQTGGGTDDTAILQAFLMPGGSCPTGPVVLIMDGPALISGLPAGLRHCSNTAIQCLPGSQPNLSATTGQGGFFYASGSNGWVIANFNPSGSSITVSNVSITGCFINGNNGGTNRPNNALQQADHSYNPCIQAWGTSNLYLANNLTLNCAFTGISVSGQNIFESNNRFEYSPNTNLTTGGTDLRGNTVAGGTSNVRVINETVCGGDDGLAMNTRNYGSAVVGPFITGGPITHVLVDGLFGDCAAAPWNWAGIDLISANGFPMDDITIRNVSGNQQNYCVYVQNDRNNLGFADNGNFGDILVDNTDCVMQGPAFGSFITGGQFPVDATISTYRLRNIRSSGIADPTIINATTNAYVGQLLTDYTNASVTTGVISTTTFPPSPVENFRYPNGALPSPWTGYGLNGNPIVPPTVSSLQLTCTNAAQLCASIYGNVPLPPGPQFAEVTAAATGGDANASINAMADIQTPNPQPAALFNGNHYECLALNGNILMRKWVANTPTTLQTVAQAITAGDKLRIYAVNDATGHLSCYYNGTVIASQTDTTFTKGSVGIGIFGTTSHAKVSQWTGGYLQSDQRSQFIAAQGQPCTTTELALSAGWQSTGSATVTAPSGTGQTCSWTITTGTTTAANPTVTDTLLAPLPNATTVCELNIHGGTHTAAAGEGFTHTSLSATAPVFTFVGTPTAGGTTYFVTRRCGP